MTGCSAPFCTNSSTKGYLMKVFPRDPLRRAEWIKNVNLPNWLPKENSCLCEVHFAPEMWEQKRVDNKRKLKPNAVPTIFGYYIKKKPVIPMRTNEAQQTLVNSETLSHESISFNTENINQNEILVNAGSTTEDIRLSVTDSNSQLDTFIISEAEKEHLNERLLKFLNKQQREVMILRKKLKCCKYKVRILEERLGKDKYRMALCRVFNEDQIKALLSKKIPREWSYDTVKRALELKSICGNNGYAALKKMGIPLPSTRTLQRMSTKINNL
ncbi:THAP domain-containing protein 2-like isoform X1 [Chelonus insularis]|uniref:THAP domain-containing protein 2-like isoform X1 n=1 Tax=Chelonus insularis TaxID=460826 RepID=UPI00158AF996|nr:THAP domain-containing protein 2-like isoform X1 [Chelonus insularis]